MPHLDAKICTHHGPETRLSRLDVFRLKQAELRRNEAIRLAHQRYLEDIDEVFAGRREEPALANSFRWPWLADIRAIARRVRHG